MSIFDNDNILALKYNYAYQRSQRVALRELRAAIAQYYRVCSEFKINKTDLERLTKEGVEAVDALYHKEHARKQADSRTLATD